MSLSLSGVSNSLAVMLLGRFLVGTGMGLGPPVAALYVTEVYINVVCGSFSATSFKPLMKIFFKF